MTHVILLLLASVVIFLGVGGTKPGGLAEENAIYLDLTFAHKSTIHFERDYIDTPRNIPTRREGGMLFTEKGLYQFSFRCTSHDPHFYPIYIGYTNESFRDRMTHSGNPHSVPKAIKAGLFTAPSGCDDIKDNLYWTLIICDNVVVSKVIESMFLATFDFALNSEENDGKREIHHIPNVQIDVGTSRQHLNAVMSQFHHDLTHFSSYQRLP